MTKKYHHKAEVIPLSLNRLKAEIGGGLISFPVTPFTADGSKVDYDASARRTMGASSLYQLAKRGVDVLGIDLFCCIDPLKLGLAA